MRPFIVLALALCLSETALSADQTIKIRVSETAGIRRFGYPVSVILPLAESVKDTDHFRLLDGNTPVTAQFRPHGDTSKGIRAVSLDFNASPGPLERHDYVVEYGNGVTGSELKKGLLVEATDKEFRIIHPSDLQFVVPRDLAGLLSQAQTKKLKFLNPKSTGLMVWNKAHNRRDSGGNGLRETARIVPSKMSSKVIKDGPLAVGLRFEGSQTLGDAVQLPFTVDMEFPFSKSWVRVDWSIEDKRGDIASLGAHLNLHVEDEPTLVDFGAGTLVYAHLKRGQSARLRQNDSANSEIAGLWETFVGPVGELKQFVVAPPKPIAQDRLPSRGPVRQVLDKSSLPRDAEGWAHVMDSERCTAVAVADFAVGQYGADIIVDADGSLRLWRHFPPPDDEGRGGTKHLTFWLHFVDMPVHVGAATSPQAMLAPLRVEVGDKR